MIYNLETLEWTLQRCLDTNLVKVYKLPDSNLIEVAGVTKKYIEFKIQVSSIFTTKKELVWRIKRRLDIIQKIGLDSPALEGQLLGIIYA